MGLLDGLFGKGESAPEGARGGKSFTLNTSFRPMRLAARSDNSVELIIELQNISGQSQLCSVVVEVPKGLGFDGVGLHKTKELRIGQLPAGETKRISVGLHASSQTPAGNYRIQITAYSHYRDYSHVLNSASKPAELRVV